MTPEQVERLKRVAEAFAEQTPDLAADIRALLAEWEERGREVERLRAELAELQRSYDFMSGEAHKREQAEARLARCVEALDRTLTEAGMQAHKHGCPERLCRPAKWDEHAPCAGCQAEAALAVKGGE